MLESARGFPQLILIGLCLLVMVGCAVTTQPVNQFQMVAQNDEFRVYLVTDHLSYSEILSRLEAPKQYTVTLSDLELINGPRTVGQTLVAVPNKPLNPAGFYAEGYRTIPILCYHQFTNEKQARQRLEVTAGQFREQLEYLRDHNYSVLTMAQLEKVYRGEMSMPDKAVVLTIDDGYRSVYDIAYPILKEFQMPATLYVYTDFVGGGAAVSWSQLRELSQAEYMDVQSHGKSHFSLSRLEEDVSEAAYETRVLSELETFKKILERRLSENVWQISYPYGNASAALPPLLKKANYRLGFTVTRGDNTGAADPNFLYRTMIYSDHNLEDFANFVDGFKETVLR